VRKLARRLRRSLAFLPTGVPKTRAKAKGQSKLKTELPPAIEISLVSAEAIGQVHAEFLDDPSPTDVITFDHGEILVCPAVAREQGKAYRRTLEEEVLLYGIHGLLHLLGWSDLTPVKRASMAREQERIWRRVLALERAKA